MKYFPEITALTLLCLRDLAIERDNADVTDNSSTPPSHA